MNVGRREILYFSRGDPSPQLARANFSSNRHNGARGDNSTVSDLNAGQHDSTDANSSEAADSNVAQHDATARDCMCSYHAILA